MHFKWICIQTKIWPNIGTLLNGVLTPKLLNRPFDSWSLINIDFVLPHIAHFDNIVVLLLPVFKTLGFMFSISFLHFKQYDLIFILTCIYCFKLLLTISLRLITSLIPIFLFFYAFFNQAIFFNVASLNFHILMLSFNSW